MTGNAYPDAELVGDFAPGSPEWHAARSDGLGGSEMAAVLGLSPWESPYSLWHRKAGLIDRQAPTEAMRWGHLLEPVIAGEFAQRHPEIVVAQAGTFRNAIRPWQIANPDRATVDSFGVFGALEIKTARSAEDWGAQGTDDIPVYYRTQVMHYMDALGLGEIHVAVLIGGSEYREYLVEYDPRDVAIMREAGELFMRSLAAGEPPSIDDHEETYRSIKRLTIRVEDATVEISPALAERYFATSAALKEAEAARRQVSAEVLAAIGTGRRAECGGVPVATRAVRADGTTHSLQPAKG